MNPVACDFQKGYCQYEDVTGYDEFDWQRWKGSTPSWGTGPTADHTLGTPDGKLVRVAMTTTPRMAWGMVGATLVTFSDALSWVPRNPCSGWLQPGG